MSIYWNNILLKKISINHNKRVKYKIKTNLGRFYFYLKKNNDVNEHSFSGKIVFFPKKT